LNQVYLSKTDLVNKSSLANNNWRIKVTKLPKNGKV